MHLASRPSRSRSRRHSRARCCGTPRRDPDPCAVHAPRQYANRAGELADRPRVRGPEPSRPSSQARNHAGSVRTVTPRIGLGAGTPNRSRGASSPTRITSDPDRGPARLGVGATGVGRPGGGRRVGLRGPRHLRDRRLSWRIPPEGPVRACRLRTTQLRPAHAPHLPFARTCHRPLCSSCVWSASPPAATGVSGK